MSETRWLDPAEQKAWQGLRAATALLDVALDRQLQRDFGISHASYVILSALSMADGRTMHMNELAVVTSSSQSRLSHAVARLEEAGWVERSRCPDNRRLVHAHLTDTGWALVVQAAPGHAEQVRRLLFDVLSTRQVAALSAITGAALTTLAADGFEIPPIWGEQPR